MIRISITAAFQAAGAASPRPCVRHGRGAPLALEGDSMSQRAAVIAAANSKGGSGKSTAILILAGE